MKFEKLNENKIRITLSLKDLQEKDIDFHDFMSNSLETQDLFLDMLEEAEEKVGFNTKNYRVKIEALAMTDMDFIITVTRIIPDSEKLRSNVAVPKKKFKACRRKTESKTNKAVYKFSSFDDYCTFIQFLSQNHPTDAIYVASDISVYLYQNYYYLVLSDINLDNIHITKFYSSITEFATYINNSELFISKLHECGKLVIKNNAIKTSLKHFSTVKKCK